MGPLAFDWVASAAFIARGGLRPWTCFSATSRCNVEGSLHVSDGHGLSAAPAVPGMLAAVTEESKLRAEAEADTGVQTHESCRGQYVPYKCAMPNPRSYGIHPEERLGDTGMHLAPAAPAV